MKSICWFCIACGFVFVLKSCCCPIEPSYIGSTPKAPQDKWDPPCNSSLDTCLPDLEDHPLSLGELVDTGLRNNPRTSISWNLARKAAFDVGVSKSELYPTIEGQETLTFDEVGGPGASNEVVDGIDTDGLPNYTQIVTHELIINYLLLDFGGRSSRIEYARLGLLAANWSHNRLIQDVMLDILRSYYSYESAKAFLAAREQDLKDSKTSLDASLALFNAGITTKVDTLLAQSNYVNNELAVITIKGQLNTAMGQLATAIGMPADTQVNVEEVSKDLPLDAISKGMTALIETAKEERPDLAVTYMEFLQKQEKVIQANSEGLPKLFTEVDLSQTNFIHQPSFNSFDYNANITLNVPIFAGFFYIFQSASARADSEAAFAAWREKQNTVLLDVVTSYYSYSTAIGTLKFSEEYIKYSQEAYDAALASYKEGVGSILDLLAAQTQLSNARAQIVQAKTQLLISAIGIAYSTGTL